MGCKTCEKPKVTYRKGMWSPEEDQKLRDCILMHGHSCWSSVPEKAGLQRNAKSCRLRWINYLRPGLKHGVFSPGEEAIVIKLHEMLGNKWSRMAMHLPGRTDNEIKNYWNSHLKKKVTKTEGSSRHAFSTPSSQEMISAQLIPSDSLSSTESSQSKVHVCRDTSLKAKQTLFPVIFADWLPVDHAAGQSSACSDNGLNWRCGSSSNSDVVVSELLEVVVSRKHEIVHDFEDTSIYRDLQSQLEYEHEAQIPEGSLHDQIVSNDETGGSIFELDYNLFFDAIYIF